MKGFLPLLGLLLFLVQMGAEAQSNQTVNNGDTTTSVTFPAEGCTYTWTNSNPAIGLPASGQGNIASFKAVNTGASPVTATITATPHSPGFAYITNYGSGTVSIIDIQTNTVVGYIVIGQPPYPVVVSPDGSRVYIGLEVSSPTISYGAVYVVNLPNGVPASFSDGNNPQAVAISPDGQHIYVCSQNPDEVVVVDATTLAPVAYIPVGIRADGICVSPDGKRVYVSNYQTPSVSVINAATNSVLTTINVPAPVGLVVSPDNSTLYVTSKTGNVVNVINTASNTVVGSIAVGKGPDGIALSSDGSTLYVTNEQDNTVSVIKTSDGTTIATVSVGENPIGISITPDGTRVYVADELSNSVSVINTTSNQVIATIPVGVDPIAFGNFITAGGCPPVSFTITVNPAVVVPALTVSTASGAITACAGTASTNLQQFTLSGSNLTGNIALTAPTNFEISTSQTGGFSGTLTLTASSGSVNQTTIYVRSAATAPAGPISGNVNISSPGASGGQVAVSGTVSALPAVNTVSDQTVTAGSPVTAINFSGAANSYNWTNDTPSIGLAASGSGNISSFTANNTGASPVTATIKVTPVSAGGGCPGVPVTFTITVNPATGPPLITATGNPAPLTTVYGTPSVSTSFNVSGVDISAGIVVTAPAGFEVSLDNSNFSPIVTVGSSGAISATTVYIRLASSTPVGNYGGNIIFTSAGAPEATLAMPQSTVTPALLTVIADDKTKHYGTPNPELTASYIGFVNFDTPLQLVTGAVLATIAVTNSPVGEYPITVSGASSPNYNITFLAGTLTIVPAGNALVIPNTFTPNGDGVNDTWQIQYLSLFTNCSVDIFTRWGQKIYSSVGYSIPWDGTYKGAALPVGTYYYIINLKNGSGPLAGFVAIIK